MFARQAGQLGAVALKGGERGEAPGLGVDQSLLGLDHVEIAEAAAIEAVADEIDGLGLGGQDLGLQPSRFVGADRETGLQSGDAAFGERARRREIGFRGGVFGSGPSDGVLVGVVAGQGTEPPTTKATSPPSLR